MGKYSHVLRPKLPKKSDFHDFGEIIQMFLRPTFSRSEFHDLGETIKMFCDQNPQNVISWEKFEHGFIIFIVSLCSRFRGRPKAQPTKIPLRIISGSGSFTSATSIAQECFSWATFFLPYVRTKSQPGPGPQTINQIRVP